MWRWRSKGDLPPLGRRGPVEMIKTKQFGDVLQINMGREKDGQVLYWVSAYLVDGLLIDTGCAHTAYELVDFLKDFNVHTAVNTHYHEDHIGANSLLQKTLGIDIFAHKDSVPLINKVPELYPYQEMVWGYPEPSKVNCMPESIETDRFHFDVVNTPGHCRGHIALIEPENSWCFTGDLFVDERPKVIRSDEDVQQIIKSMQRLMELPSRELVLFTSVRKIVEGGKKALKTCIEYLRDISDQAKKLEREGHSIKDIVRVLLGGEGLFPELTNGQFSSENLIRSVLRK